jgi:hypothetical protein
VKSSTRQKFRSAAGFLALAVVYTTQSGYDACSGDLLHDSGFDMWCGEELCSWKVERGEARKAPTWHASDLGVDLIGDDVVISQRSRVDNYNAPCVRFELVADIAETATVTVEMDLFGDGEVDYERELPTSSWAPLRYLVSMPGYYQGIVFRLRKQGSGRAVLAQIRPRSVDVVECAGAVGLEQKPVPLGGACYSGEDDDPFRPVPSLCETGTCTVTRPGDFLPIACAECESDDDCGEGVCGVESRVSAFFEPYRACVPAASKVLGERCFTNGECGSGVCCSGLCAGCCAADGRGCPDGQSCFGVIREDGLFSPDQCEPGGRAGEPGSPCLTGDDCASGDCTGGEELRLCPADSRRCTDDGDCPPDELDKMEGREFGSCTALGTAGGSCR